MRKIGILVFLLFIHIAKVNAQINIPYGKIPTIDGQVDSLEWADADSVQLLISGGEKTIGVLYKHDSSNLYVAYLRNLESMNVRFPEILIDTKHDKGTDWQSDDWYFHVSQSDCEFQGTYGNYSNCQAIRPNWKAENNLSPGLPITDSVEIQIPFSLIGININTIDSIGICFAAASPILVKERWPIDANHLVPSTWGTAYFGEKKSTLISEISNLNDVHIEIFPNPSNAKSINVETNNLNEDYEIIIRNSVGQLITQKQIVSVGLKNSNSLLIETSEGYYIVEIKTIKHSYFKTIIKN